MLYSTLTHPNILRALAAAGHGSQILIADGNYPLATQTPYGGAWHTWDQGVKIWEVMKKIAAPVPERRCTSSGRHGRPTRAGWREHWRLRRPW